jgi:hypothetical protein
MSIQDNSDKINVLLRDSKGRPIDGFNNRRGQYSRYVGRDDDGGVIREDAQTAPNVQQNVLHQYSSFNSIFTLAVLTVDEINNPASLRVRSPDKIILKSGGSGGNKFKTDYDKGAGVREFFITDVEIKTTISPNPKTKHTNAYDISFTVVEPYSLGLFIETLRTTASATGHKNHTSAPYCLVIDFLGYDSTGKAFNVENSRRIIPFKFSTVNFEATQAGSMYACTAISWNEQALYAGIQTLSNDITIKGSTVQEMLQVSLQKEINAIKKSRNKDKKELQPRLDDYIINFPMKDAAQKARNGISVSKDESNQGKIDPDQQRKELLGTGTNVRTTKEGISYKQDKNSLNAIGKMKMLVGKDQVEDVTQSNLFELNKKIIDIAQVARLSKEGKLTFKAGTNIEHIITNVIIFSELAAKSLANDNSAMFKNWFRIYTRCFIIQDEEIFEKYGNYPKLYVYDVIEYQVHSSVFAKPNVKTNTEDFEPLIIKEYDYLFSGRNLDVLDFQIKIDFAFHTVLPMDNAKSKSRDNDKTRAEKDKVNTQDTSDGEAAKNSTATGVTQVGVVRRQFNTYESISGLSDEQRLALEFNESIIHSTAELAVVDLTILGDPYFIADDGMGNYNSSPSDDSPFINKDGAIQPIFGAVYVTLNFRTPIDVTSEGALFKDTANTGEKFIPVPSFSGVYRVNLVDNIFQNGVFKQVLQMTRVPNQEVKGPVGESALKPGTYDPADQPDLNTFGGEGGPSA